jgi:hypothetical protein
LRRSTISSARVIRSRWARRQAGAIAVVSTQYPSMCMSSMLPCTHDISVAGTNTIPRSVAASAASVTPSTVSWSVSASVVTPASAAAATTAAGGSSPSENVEWL